MKRPIYQTIRTRRWGWNPIRKRMMWIHGYKSVQVGYKKLTPAEEKNARMFTEIRAARNRGEIDAEEEGEGGGGEGL